MTTLDAIADDFQMVDDETRLELLLDYAARLPPLPEAYHPLRDRGLNMVHECQSPVFLMVEVKDGRVAIHADVPEEAPTARSFTAIMVEAFDGATPDAVAAAPGDVLHRLGLANLLGMQRTRGLSAIYRRIKNEVARQA
ncbi:MAG: SufE family protein [Rhodothermales bacterium]|nr:SufE family protein [Rhodothermales bacterium]